MSEETSEINKDNIYWVIKLKEIGFYSSHAVDIVKGVVLTDSKFESIKRLKEADGSQCFGYDIVNYEEAGIL